mmetsp:Transcript_46394/g.91721  ORF Transcript_46394/g.91721 Transcript_46394/m.91721 type:complete len:221 (-) Transcript_46394:363-1025(-)
MPRGRERQLMGQGAASGMTKFEGMGPAPPAPVDLTFPGRPRTLGTGFSPLTGAGAGGGLRNSGYCTPYSITASMRASNETDPGSPAIWAEAGGRPAGDFFFFGSVSTSPSPLLALASFSASSKAFCALAAAALLTFLTLPGASSGPPSPPASAPDLGAEGALNCHSKPMSSSACTRPGWSFTYRPVARMAATRMPSRSPCISVGHDSSGGTTKREGTRTV